MDEHDHDHDHEHEEAPDLSDWASTVATATCPNCGATGAVTLGGGLFCPTCKQVSTNPGYQAPS